MDNRELVRLAHEQSDMYDAMGQHGIADLLTKLRAALESAEKAAQEVGYIANAKRFDRDEFADDTEFADWAQSRCRAALSAKGSS